MLFRSPFPFLGTTGGGINSLSTVLPWLGAESNAFLKPANEGAGAGRCDAANEWSVFQTAGLIRKERTATTAFCST